MNRIRVFLCCHKQYETIPPLCEPIQCGAALVPRMDGILHDCDGESISEKNKEYCELTAHYYAWKNIEADFFGFCHYRRFFGAENSAKLPYLALKTPSASQLLSENELRELCGSFDIIVPRAEDMGLPAREHYISSKHHYAADLELFLEILYSMSPAIKNVAEQYLAQNRQYFCNMFIMDRQLFNEYCGILFSVLEEFDRRKVMHGDFQSDRTDGYLGEIFTGIYICYCRNNGAKIKELPRLDTGCTVKKRLGCAVLPPESKIRFAAKRLAKKLRSCP